MGNNLNEISALFLFDKNYIIDELIFVHKDVIHALRSIQKIQNHLNLDQDSTVQLAIVFQKGKSVFSTEYDLDKGLLKSQCFGNGLNQEIINHVLEALDLS